MTSNKKILITGGLGFIGTNTSLHFLAEGYDVHIIDNLSRETSVNNFQIIKQTNAIVHIGDICNADFINKLFKDHKYFAVVHLAAQVAVTTSISDPCNDFSINVIGTLNLLEAVRLYSSNSIFLNASTNKVYGSLENVEIELTKKGYFYKSIGGINENENLDFYTPYGCSKGAAEQYVLDYCRIFNLKTISFRQSCIYGKYQYGVEDQGWISWFLLAARQDKQIFVYGDGNQTRDILYVSDLVRLYENAIVNNNNNNYGHAFNVGGGYENYISVNDVLSYLKDKYKNNLTIKFSEWRPGDQKVFVADITKVKKHFGWEPKVKVYEGLDLISQWTFK